jgi:hypothetical protein
MAISLSTRRRESGEEEDDTHLEIQLPFPIRQHLPALRALREVIEKFVNGVAHVHGRQLAVRVGHCADAAELRCASVWSGYKGSTGSVEDDGEQKKA